MKIRLMFVSNSSSSSSIVYIPKNFKLDLKIEDIPEKVKDRMMEESEEDLEFGETQLDDLTTALAELASGKILNESDTPECLFSAIEYYMEPYDLTSIDSYGGCGNGAIIPITEKDIERVTKKIK